MTQFDNRTILVGSHIAKRSDMARLVSNVIHELVHAHLQLHDPDHCKDAHGADFMEQRYVILQRFQIDIDHDHRADWSIYQQSRFYKLIYAKWRCQNCGFEKAYKNTTRKPNGITMGFHKVTIDDEDVQCPGRQFKRVAFKDFRDKKPRKRIIKDEPAKQPAKKRRRII